MIEQLILSASMVASFGYAIFALVRGKVWGSGYTKRQVAVWGRDTNPRYYWINVGLYFTIGIILSYKYWSWYL